MILPAAPARSAHGPALQATRTPTGAQAERTPVQPYRSRARSRRAQRRVHADAARRWARRSGGAALDGGTLQHRLGARELGPGRGRGEGGEGDSECARHGLGRRGRGLGAREHDRPPPTAPRSSVPSYTSLSRSVNSAVDLRRPPPRATPVLSPRLHTSLRLRVLHHARDYPPAPRRCPHAHVRPVLHASRAAPSSR